MCSVFYTVKRFALSGEIFSTTFKQESVQKLRKPQKKKSKWNNLNTQKQGAKCKFEGIRHNKGNAHVIAWFGKCKEDMQWAWASVVEQRGDGV